VVIEVQDDGGGIDLEKVKAKAVAQGILRPGEELTDDGSTRSSSAPASPPRKR